MFGGAPSERIHSLPVLWWLASVTHIPTAELIHVSWAALLLYEIPLQEDKLTLLLFGAVWTHRVCEHSLSGVRCARASISLAEQALLFCQVIQTCGPKCCAHGLSRGRAGASPLPRILVSTWHRQVTLQLSPFRCEQNGIALRLCFERPWWWMRSRASL